MSRNDVPVVITRKHKKMGWFGHLFAFAVTGGASAPVSGAMAVHKASYNARTRKLAGQGRVTSDAQFRADHVPGSAEYKAKHGS